jgi:hypothetical protein
MPQRVKTQFVRSTASAAALVRAPVRCFLQAIFSFSISTRYENRRRKLQKASAILP